jgi:WD40 repeat protein
MADSRRGTERKLNVFISYSRNDMVFADKLDEALRICGFETLIDRTEIYAFEDWWKRIQSLIIQADAVIFLLSPDAIASEICQKEVAFAASLNKRFAPIVYRQVDVEAVPRDLSQLNFIFFDDEKVFNQSFSRLSEALTTNIDWIRRHTEFGTSSRNWDAAKRPNGLLFRSPLLEQAEEWIASRPHGAPEPTAETREFIALSRRAKTQLWNRLIFSLLVGLVLSAGLAGFAFWQRSLANQQRNQALLAQSQYLADASRELIDRDPVAAMLLALEGLPDGASDNAVQRERPYWAQAESSLEGGRRRTFERAILQGNFGSIAMTPDGSMVAVGATDGTTLLWDTKTLSVRGTLTGDAAQVRSVAVTADGEYVVTNSSDTTAKVWSTRTLALVGRLDGHTAKIESVAVSSNGSRIVTGAADGTVRLWDLMTSSLLGTLAGDTRPVRKVAIAANGAFFAGASGTTVKVWSGIDISEIGELRGHTGDVTDLAVTQDGSLIVSSSTDKTVRVWDTREWRQVGMLDEAAWVSSVAVSKDGSRIVTGSTDSKIRIYEVRTTLGSSAREWKLVGQLGGMNSWIMGVAVTSDGMRVVAVAPFERLLRSGFSIARPYASISAAQVVTVRLWDALKFDTIGELKDRAEVDKIVSVAVNGDASRIVTGSGELWSAEPGRNNIARVWDANTLEEIGQLKGHTGSVLSVAVTPNFDRIITGSADGTARVWDARTLAEVGQLVGHTDKIVSVAVIPDASRIVTGSHDGTARIWNAISLLEVGRIGGEHGKIYSVASSANGKFIVAGTSDGATVWEPVVDNRDNSPNWQKVWQSEQFEYVRVVAISPDASFIVAAASDGNPRVWARDPTINTSKPNSMWRLLGELVGHSKGLLSLTITTDNSRIVTGSRDNTLRIWNAKTLAEVGLLSHTNWVTGVAATSDGKQLFSVSMDNSLRQWRVFPTGQTLIDQVKASASRCLSLSERDYYHVPPNLPSWCAIFDRK